MTFGRYFEEKGWTVITLSQEKAIEFSFEPNSKMISWLNDTLPESDWQQVSFRKLAFRKTGNAVLFKLTCC